MAEGIIIDMATRQDVNAFSQWTVGNSVRPTAVNQTIEPLNNTLFEMVSK
jgi:hypothetical protein